MTTRFAQGGLDRLRSRIARPALALAVPLVLATAAYARVLEGDFQFDDSVYFERRAAVWDVRRYLADRFAQEFASVGRPVTDLTFALNTAAGGLVPWNFHVTNLAIHLAVVVLVWAFTRSVLRLAGAARAEWLAVGVGGAFALHPMQSEAVSYISQRAEALASGLYLAALLLLLLAERRGLGKRALAPWLGALAVFVLAIGAKAIAVTLPAAWVLLVALLPDPARRGELAPWRRRAVALVPFVLVDLLYAARTLRVLETRVDAGFAVPGVAPGSYVLTEIRAIPVYLRLLFWPSGLNVDWDFPQSRSLAEPTVALSALFLLALVAGAVLLAWAARRRAGEGAGAARVAAFGALWFFLVLLPTSSVVPLADVLVEHRVYLAAWGVIVAVAVALERLAARVAPRRRLAFPAAAAVGVVLGWAAPAAALHRRNAVWETRRALWTDCVAKSPNKARPWHNLSSAMLAEGALEESLRASFAALERLRDQPVLELMILRNMMASYIRLGRLDDVEATLRRALARGHAEPDILTNLAGAVLRRGGVAEAESLALRAIGVAPGDAHAWSVLGEISLARHDSAAALPMFDRCVQAAPVLAGCRYSRGLALAALGRTVEACASWAEVDPAGQPDLRAALERALAENRCGARR